MPAWAPGSRPNIIGSDLGLTARELEVLAALAEGLSNKEIAEHLFISGKTVSSHLEHIFEKLHVHSRVEAAGIASRLGVAAPLYAAGRGE